MVTHLQYSRLEAIKRSTHIAFTFNTDEDVGPEGYRIFLDQGSEGRPPGKRVQDSAKDEITLLDMAMVDDVTLEGTTFPDNAWGMNALRKTLTCGSDAARSVFTIFMSCKNEK